MTKLVHLKPTKGLKLPLQTSSGPSRNYKPFADRFQLFFQLLLEITHSVLESFVLTDAHQELFVVFWARDETGNRNDEYFWGEEKKPSILLKML